MGKKIIIGLGLLILIIIIGFSANKDSSKEIENKKSLIDNQQTNKNIASQEPVFVYSNEYGGYGLGIIDYTFVKKTEDYGVITSLDVGILNNQGSEIIFPDLQVTITGTEKNPNIAIVELGEVLSGDSDSFFGNYFVGNVKTNIPISKIGEKKEVKIALFEPYGKVLVTVKFTTNFSEGLK